MKILKYLSCGFAIIALACLGVYGSGSTINGEVTISGNLTVKGTCTGCASANAVLATSPGVGLAHFAGSTQTVTSSAVNLAGGSNEVTGLLPGANGGGLRMLEHHTASGVASLDFTTCLTSTYDTYMITLVNLVPATTGQTFRMLVSTDGGMNWQASTYSGSEYRIANGSSAAATAQTTYMDLTVGSTMSNSTSYGLSGVLFLYNASSSTLFKRLNIQTTYFDGSNPVSGTGGVEWDTATAINAFQFKMGSGNLNSGDAYCYGIAKS